MSHGLHFSAAKILMTELCLSLQHRVWFAAILNSLKTNIFVRLEWFLLWTNSKQYRVYIYEKKFWKKNFLKKNFPYLLNDLCIHLDEAVNDL